MISEAGLGYRVRPNFPQTNQNPQLTKQKYGEQVWGSGVRPGQPGRMVGDLEVSLVSTFFMGRVSPGCGDAV